MNKDDLYTMMENERAFENGAMLVMFDKVLDMKEPLLQQALSERGLSEKEIGFLLAL